MYGKAISIKAMVDSTADQLKDTKIDIPKILSHPICQPELISSKTEESQFPNLKISL